MHHSESNVIELVSRIEKPYETGPAPRAKIVALLDDLLPAGLSSQQKARRASNLLKKMKDTDGTVDCDGTGKAARWRIM